MPTITIKRADNGYMAVCEYKDLKTGQYVTKNQILQTEKEVVEFLKCWFEWVK